MPWKECSTVNERMKFVSRLLDGERMTDLCNEFGISRKTGYKIYSRFNEEGLVGLEDKSHVARSHPNLTPEHIQRAIINLRREHPTWGAPKIKVVLERKNPKWIVPATSTIHSVLDREQLVKRRMRKTILRAEGTDLSKPKAPNQLWCADFKGQFRLGNKSLCYPLTITDNFSRYLLSCEALESTQDLETRRHFARIFEEFGLPDAIRSDNGVPFGARSYFGLSKLSVFCLTLGIKLERIEPGHPEQNGSHERMHRTLKADAIATPGKTILSQQETFDSFREVYNKERPHQAIKMKCPNDLYRKSSRTFNPIQDPLEYPHHDRTLQVRPNGSITLHGRTRLYIGDPFGGYNVGIKQIDEDIWKVSFMDYDLGFFNYSKPVIQISTNPFLIKASN